MLYLIGMGLWDENDLTLKGLEIARKCERVYLETYTDFLGGLSKDNLEEMLEKEVRPLSREQVEENPFFVPEAIGWDIALLVGGDPLVATTHSDLLLRCKESGVKYKIIHNASIYSAIAETGLQIYKFGKTATVVFWEGNYKPKSFYDVVLENKKRKLHTLLLLDIRPGKLMTPNEAIEILSEINEKFKKQEIVILSRAGSDAPGIAYGQAEVLEKGDYGKGPHVLIIPGSLHPLEKEMLEFLSSRAKRKP
ncbi:diphthine synthase [archaeon]|nr:diphthine synthase [archaeon]